MRASAAWAYITQEGPVTPYQWARDYGCHLTDQYTLERLRRAYRASQRLVEESEPDEWERRPPPGERMRDLDSTDPRRMVAVLTDTDWDG